jgi:DNA-binding beta-propeller fold protein YncE
MIQKPLLLGVLLIACSAPSFGADRLPDYRSVAGWPQLPGDIKLGPVSAVATDAKDRVFVFHRGPKPVLIFEPSGKFIRSWGDEYLKTPHGLRIDHEGNVWVTDIGNHQVMKFDPDGKLLLSLGKKGMAGTADDQFDRPTDVAVAKSGEFYVSDGYGNSRVLKFAADGKLLKQWGKKGTGEGEFNLPHAIVLDAKGRVYVGDRENSRIQIFDGDGKYLSTWKESGAPYGLFLYGDRMFVADGVANWVKVLDANGKPLGRFGEKGTGPGQFQLPHMLCVDSHGDVYVTEINGKRTQKFTPASPIPKKDNH